MQIRKIMSTEVACCTPDMGLQRAAQMMIEHDCGALPVCESVASKKLVGIITDRDIVCRTVAQARNPLELKVQDCMSKPVTCVSPDTKIKECCETMEKNRVRRVPVVDKEGNCCGIVSQADIALHSSQRQTAAVVKIVSHPSPEPSAVGEQQSVGVSE